jgi:hypothetical protein
LRASEIQEETTIITSRLSREPLCFFAARWPLIDDSRGGPGVRPRKRFHKKPGKWVIAALIHRVTGCFIRLSKKATTGAKPDRSGSIIPFDRYERRALSRRRSATRAWASTRLAHPHLACAPRTTAGKASLVLTSISSSPSSRPAPAQPPPLAAAGCRRGRARRNRTASRSIW